MNYELKILDTTDSYVLAFIGNGLNKNKILPTYERLYNEIGVSINVIDTEHKMLAEDTRDFIKQTCGAVIPTSLPFCGLSNHLVKDVGSVLDKLLSDIQTVIQFNRVSKFWKLYNNHSSTSFKALECPVEGVASPTVKELESTSETLSKPTERLHDAFNQKLLPANHVKKPSRYVEKITYVLWNTTYSIAIIFADELDVISAVTKNLAEWEVVYILSPMDESIIQACRLALHKKTFENVNDIKKRIESLKDAFGYNEKTNTALMVDTATIHKNTLIDCIEKNYDISKDSNSKVRATDIYKHLCNQFCIDYAQEATFKRKLIGHLLELGVVKKRFSDGYYFCGITKKNT